MHTIWQCPDDALAALVLAHGAGAGMKHRHMQALADAFAQEGIATLRFDFPFVEAGRKRADPPAVAVERIAEAFSAAQARASLPLWLGGHSFGGRMASHALLERPLAARGLVLCSFPLHPAGKPGIARAAHLGRIDKPMLFLSGSRDALAELDLLEQVVAKLPSAKLHVLDAADHGYRVRAQARANRASVYVEAARAARAFMT